jgi:hypothetical protein
MRQTDKAQSEWNIGDFWLSVPQAVYLEATRDIETAIKLSAEEPGVLVTNVTLRLGRIDIPDATDLHPREAKEAALRALTSQRGRYDAALHRVQQRLIGGLAAKGRRASGLPLEMIDPADFTGLELSGVDAINATTRQAVWHDLRTSARAQVEALARETRFEPWDITGGQLPKLLEWARSIWGKDLDQLPGRDELLRRFRHQFGPVRGTSQAIMREVRQHLASERAKTGGTPTHRR